MNTVTDNRNELGNKTDKFSTLLELITSLYSVKNEIYYKIPGV